MPPKQIKRQSTYFITAEITSTERPRAIQPKMAREHELN